MKRKNLGVAAFVFLMPLLVSANYENPTSSGYFTGMSLPPMHLGEDYTFKMRFDTYKDRYSEHILTVTLGNSKTVGVDAHNDQSYYLDQYSPIMDAKYTFNGIGSIEKTLTIPAKYVDTYNRFSFIDKTDDVTYYYGTTLHIFADTSTEGREITDGFETRGSTSAVINEGRFINTAPWLKVSGIQKTYDAESMNKVPFDKIVFHCVNFDYNQYPCPLNSDKLRVYIEGKNAKQFASMNFGMPIMEDLFALSLSFVPINDQGDFILALPNNKFVLDPYSGEEFNYNVFSKRVKTRDLFLPHQGDKPETYSFRVVDDDPERFGHLYFSFTVTARFNYLGNCANSYWCVGME